MSILRVALTLMIAAAALPAGTLFFEDFEGPDVLNVQSQSSGVLSGTLFQVVSGSVDVVTSTDVYAGLCSAPASGNCIDTTGGGGGGLGTIETIDTIFFAPGLYSISFDLIGWYFPTSNLSQTATVEASIGSLWSGSFIRTGSANPYPRFYTHFTVDVPTSARLQFSTIAGSGFAGAVLDNVEVATATPEPSTLFLVGAAILGGAFCRRRRSAA